MPKIFWLIMLGAEMFMASKYAFDNNIAVTILFCFAGYLCLQFYQEERR